MKILSIPMIACCLIAPVVSASSLVYTPVNPSFGGSPLNASALMNSAQSQNDKTDPALDDEINALDDFNDRLQRAILTRLTRSVTSQIVDEEGNLLPGQTETSDFIIDVVETDTGSLTVITTDKVTGDTTQFTVDGSF